jgi:hypothetical protein
MSWRRLGERRRCEQRSTAVNSRAPTRSSKSVSFIATEGIIRAIKLTFWLTAAVTSSFGPTPAEGLDESETPQSRRAIRSASSLNTENVDVKFGPYLYRIPSNYLAGVTPARDSHSYAAFTIQVLLPDFAPRSQANLAQFNEVGWHNQFRALFEYGNHPRPQEEILALYLSNAGITKDDFQLVASGYKLYKNAKTWPREIYTRDRPDGLFLFTCGSAEDGTPFPSCRIHETFEENVGVIYSFSRKYLDQASDIDLKLHALLSNFKSN